MLLASSNHGKWLLMLPHCAASAGCLNLPSFLSSFRPSSCQCKSWTSFRVANHLLSQGMRQKYHATLTGAPLLTFFFLPLILPGSFSSSAYHLHHPFPLVPIIATLGELVMVCIISTEQYTIVLACMDLFNFYSQRIDYLLRLIDRLCYLVSFR
jgi:hypothetical protein